MACARLASSQRRQCNRPGSVGYAAECEQGRIPQCEWPKGTRHRKKRKTEKERKRPEAARNEKRNCVKVCGSLWRKEELGCDGI